MHSLLRSTLTPTTNTATKLAVSIHDVYCESYIRSTSPPVVLPEPLSPPIFSRKSMFGTGAGAHNTKDRRFGTLESIKSMILPRLEDDPQSEDRYMQDMSIVDGWRKSFVRLCIMVRTESFHLFFSRHSSHPVVPHAVSGRGGPIGPAMVIIVLFPHPSASDRDDG